MISLPSTTFLFSHCDALGETLMCTQADCAMPSQRQPGWKRTPLFIHSPHICPALNSMPVQWVPSFAKRCSSSSGFRSEITIEGSTQRQMRNLSFPAFTPSKNLASTLRGKELPFPIKNTCLQKVCQLTDP